MSNNITSFKELKFFIMADRMMNRGYFKKSVLKSFYNFFFPDVIMTYLFVMRVLQYLSNGGGNIIKCLLRIYYKRKYIRLGYRLGYSIGVNCLGYGAVLHHHGTIVIGEKNRLGNYSLINTSTCIVSNGTEIGDSFFMGAGAKIIKRVKLGNNVQIGANTVVSTQYNGDGILITGVPGKLKTDNREAWWESLYGKRWKERHDKVEELRGKMMIGTMLDKKYK